MAKAPIEFWFEFGSTYTYLTVMRIEDLAKTADVDLVWKPFLLMPVLTHLGVDNPFTSNSAKCAYMWTDLMRRAAALDIPIERPSVYPPNSLTPARVACLGMAEGWGVAFTKEAFRQHWRHDVIIGTEENTRLALTAAAPDPEAAMDRALAQTNKDALRAQTEDAITHGLFGSPSFLVTGEIFWGDDRLEDAIARAA